ncbi:unnamed protein product [Leptosia nina]|uniref:Major facilitator superfamily (MFS) profile domain-containing protein n=1 Tax=Leptosia nina TaxID=320188 RepID=A0AAV1K2C1_9NEOP
MTAREYTPVPTKELKGDSEEKPEPKYGYGHRHVQALLIFITYTLAYLARAHMGVTIVAMTNEVETDVVYTTEGYRGENITLVTDKIAEDKNTGVWNIYRTYKWPKSTQEMVLSSFYVGYFFMTFLSGMICQKWGGKIPLQIAALINGVVSILSPWVVAWGGWKALAACRILQGLSQGGLLPGIHTLLANWVPLCERGSLSSYVYMGSGLGTVIGFQASGFLAYSSFGWPSTFWTIGVLSLLGFGLFSVFGSATPADHKTIREEEKNYIIGKSEATQTQAKVPWRAILSSKHVWSAYISHIGIALAYTFCFMQVPTYMYAILKVNIKNSGLLSSLPYFSFMLFCMVTGSLADLLVNKGMLSMKNVRRLSNSVATVIPGIVLILVSYTENVILAVIYFTATLGAQSAMHTGWVINYIDLSPNYSGALMAVGNGLANLCVLILPVMVSNIVIDVTDQIQWRIMMVLIAGVTILGNVIFVIFLSADVQPWNKVGYCDVKNTDLKMEDGLKKTLKSKC